MAAVQTLTKDQLFDHYLNLDLSSKDPSTVRILFNMVATIDGITTISDPTRKIQDGFGGPIDRQLMQALRVHADCVLNGANTLRVAGANALIEYPEFLSVRRKYQMSDQPISAVLTHSADFSEQTLAGKFFTDESFQSILFVTQDTPTDRIAVIKTKSKPNLSIETISNRADNVCELVEILQKKYHVATLLVEGGAGTNASLLKAGLGNDFFLTTAPYFGLQSAQSKGITQNLTTLLRNDVITASLQSCYFVEEAGDLFEHWQISTK